MVWNFADFVQATVSKLEVLVDHGKASGYYDAEKRHGLKVVLSMTKDDDRWRFYCPVVFFKENRGYIQKLMSEEKRTWIQVIVHHENGEKTNIEFEGILDESYKGEIDEEDGFEIFSTGHLIHFNDEILKV